MSIPEEYVETLSELGLTHTEAKVYLTLLSLKSATANSIHKESNVARQEVYRVLADLEEKGLIDKIISKPAEFTPIPASGAITILLQKRNEQNRQLQKKAVKQLRNFGIDCLRKVPLPKDARFVLLSKSETNPTAHADKLGKAVDNAEKTVMCSTILPLFIKVKSMDEQVWKKAVKRGVKFKFIIGRKPNEKSELNLDPVLKNSENFEIRWTPTVIPSCVLLVDEREAFCRMGSDVECPVLWSANPSFAAVIKDYFENTWKLLEYSRKQ
jgi:sugar-specific transcriptional regulator TrmB